MRQYIMATAAVAVLALAGCSTTPETDSGYHDWPTPNIGVSGPVPGSAADFKNVGDRVFFDLNKYNIKPDGAAVVKAQAEWLKKWPSVGVVVEGHADERGTVEYNLALGERRATALSRALTAHGVDKSRIEVVSYGKEHPQNPGHDEKAWSENRRAVTTIR